MQYEQNQSQRHDISESPDCTAELHVSPQSALRQRPDLSCIHADGVIHPTVLVRRNRTVNTSILIGGRLFLT